MDDDAVRTVEEVEPPRETRKAASQGTVSTARAVDVLLYLMNNEGSGGVTEISRALGLSKAVVYRILQSFLEKDLVEVGNDLRREYRIGPTAGLLSAFAPDPFEDGPLRLAALPHLKSMSAASQETATVSALVGRFAVHIDQVASQRELRMTVKTRVPRPLTIGASSKAILAFLDPTVRDEVISTVAPGTTAFPHEGLDGLRKDLEAIREERAAVSFGERERESAAIASPVWDADGLVGAVSICGPRTRFTPDSVAKNVALVVGAAEHITAELRRG